MLSENKVKEVVRRILRELMGIPQERVYPQRRGGVENIGDDIFDRPPDHVIKIPELFWGKSKIDELKIWYSRDENRTYRVVYVGPDDKRSPTTSWDEGIIDPEEILEDHLVEMCYHQYRLSYMDSWGRVPGDPSYGER